MSSEVYIRLAQVVDVAVIRDIYNHYVLTSTSTFQIEPDTLEDRLSWFENRTAAHPVIVAEVAGEVVGWGALAPWKARAGYRFSVEASVYIREGLQRRGIGRALLLDLIERARSLGHHAIIGGACSEHPGSIALQEAMGFQRVGQFKQTGYKFGRWLDVVYLQLLLS